MFWRLIDEENLQRQLPLRRGPLECNLDLAEGTSKCNCSICAKARFWSIVKADAFRLLQGENTLSDYQFGGATGANIQHLFCSRCGVESFGRGHLDEFGGDFYAINVACLDDATTEELAKAPVRYEDGRNNNWDSPPAETRHL